MNTWLLRSFSKAWLAASFGLLLAQPEALAEDCIGDLETLYAAVDDPNNENATLKLCPGIFQLKPTHSNGTPRANRGSLLLKPGMTLMGSNQYIDTDGDQVPDSRDTQNEIYADPSTETIIDGENLNIVSQGVVSGPILVTGPTEVTIRNLTVRTGPSGQAAVEVRVPGNAMSKVTVEDCTLEKGRRGIILDAAPRWGSVNGSVELHAARNVIRENRVSNPTVPFGWGIQTAAANTVGSSFAVHLKDNRLIGNKVGLFLEVSTFQDGEVNVVSQGNIYENALFTQFIDPNGQLINIPASGITVMLRGANNQFGNKTNGNQIHLLSQGDAIWNNVGWAGLHVEATRRVANNVEMMDNEIGIQLLGTRFVKFDEQGAFDGPQNQNVVLSRRQDILVVGSNHADDNSTLPPPEKYSGIGQGNEVKLLIRHVSSSCEPTDDDHEPQPIRIFDNYPDEVEIKLPGSEALGKTNTELICH